MPKNTGYNNGVLKRRKKEKQAETKVTDEFTQKAKIQKLGRGMGR